MRFIADQKREMTRVGQIDLPDIHTVGCGRQRDKTRPVYSFERVHALCDCGPEVPAHTGSHHFGRPQVDRSRCGQNLKPERRRGSDDRTGIAGVGNVPEHNGVSVADWCVRWHVDHRDRAAWIHARCQPLQHVCRHDCQRNAGIARQRLGLMVNRERKDFMDVHPGSDRFFQQKRAIDRRATGSPSLFAASQPPDFSYARVAG